MRISKLFVTAALASVALFSLSAPAWASTAGSPDTCHSQNCDPRGGNGGNSNHGNQCRDQRPGPFTASYQQYTHPWSSCCKTEVIWAHKTVWKHGHKTTVWYRTTVRNCQQHGGDRNGRGDDHGQDGNGNGGSGGQNQGGGNDNQGWNNGGGNRPAVSCVPRTFPVTVSHGTFTETPGGPVLTSNESLMDGTFLYHVSDLQAVGSTVTFQLNGDAHPGTSLKTVCP